MNLSWEKFLDPAVLALSIPLLAVLMWGLTSVIRAIRGDSEEFAECKEELEKRRARVDELERTVQASQQPPVHR